jgi:hypothetical protein
MAQAGARIPAWRRLGLTLKSETPSGVTAPEPSTPQSDRRHFIPHGEQIDAQGLPQSPIVASVNGKSSKLGKRKHQHDPAEVDDQKPKKGRISLVEHTTSEAAATQAPPIVEPTTAPNEAPGNPPPSDTIVPKETQTIARRRKSQTRAGGILRQKQPHYPMRDQSLIRESHLTRLSHQLYLRPPKPTTRL